MIKNRILKRNITTMAKALQKRTVLVKPVKTVAVLNNPQSNLSLQNLQYLEKALNLSSSSFEIFTIKERKDYYNELRGVIATFDSFSAFGKIKSKEISTSISKKYDLFIDFTGTSNIVEKYFSLAIQSNFRVGYTNNDEIYDLMLQVEKGEIKLFIDEMVRYLKIIGLSK
jgi:hypothetical protein